MSRNVRALTNEELRFFNQNYRFELAGEFIVVSVNGFNRKTLHSIHEEFFISAKPRRINISMQAINLWMEKFKDKYSLVEVQNAINTLIVTYQSTDDNEVEKQLEVSRKNSYNE